MFKVPRVYSCPHTKGNGVVHITPEVIAELAGAVLEKDEWAVLLLGERSEDGRDVVVNDLRVPPQKRSSGDVDVDDVVITPDIVGVAHSHHHMGAWMSVTDNETLNPRFAVSIVISNKEMNQYLGFGYKAVGKVKLPCGSWGEMGFHIQPTEGPEVATANYEPVGTHLGDCLQNKEISGDAYHVGLEAACGIREEGFRANAFGRANELYTIVHAIPVEHYKKVTAKGANGGKGYKVRVNGVLLTEEDFKDTDVKYESAFTRNSEWNRVSDESVYTADEAAADRWLAKSERKRLKRERRAARKMARLQALAEAVNDPNFDQTDDVVDVEEGTIKLEWDMEAWEAEMGLSLVKRTM